MAARRLVVIAALSMLAVPTSGYAQEETGLADIHALVRQRGKLCMADHFHSGYSKGQPTKAAAGRAAIRSWQDFTGWEYGGAWGSFALSESKSLSCDGSGRNWNCAVESRPCRSMR